MQVTVFSSERGLPSLRAGAEALEDPIDPEGAAHAFVDPERVLGREHVVLFGAGLGYRARRLEALGVQPVVYEPLADILELAERRGPGLPRGARVVTDPVALRTHLVDVTRDGETTVLLTHSPYARAFPEALEAVTAVLREVQGVARLKRNTIVERSQMLVERTFENLPKLARLPRIDGLGRPLDGVPAFIVSAGPSLDRNRHLLREAAARGAILAVNTAAPAVAAAGAPIDLLVAIEALDVSENMRAAHGAIRGMALDVTASPANYLDLPTAMFMPSAGQYLDLARAVGTDPLPYGGSVATAAFAVAHRLGADPIVLLGQDLAYTDGRGYARDTLFEATTAREDGAYLVIERAAKWKEITGRGGLQVPGKLRPMIRVPAWGGAGTVPSTHDLVVFRRWFEGAAEHYRGRVRMINATEGGSAIAGFEEARLEDVLRALPERAHHLHEALAGAAPLRKAALDAVTRELEQDASALARACRRVEKAERAGRDPGPAIAAVRDAARRIPLSDAHAAPALFQIREDETLDPITRTRKTFDAIRRSASRIASLARRARR